MKRKSESIKYHLELEEYAVGDTPRYGLETYCEPITWDDVCRGIVGFNVHGFYGWGRSESRGVLRSQEKSGKTERVGKSGNFITVARKKSIIVFSIYILALKSDI